jgi:coenzyme F420-reducing hydrogenase beta subunit
MPPLPQGRRCFGCLACVDACPVGALTPVLDEEGFLQPVVDERACTGCLACVQVCPSLHPPAADGRLPTANAAWSGDDAVRLRSSSGGVFSELAHVVFREGGAVVGAAFDEELNLVHRVAETPAQLAPLRGSKYLQSNTAGIYRQTLGLLQSGRTVLFSGTPCQIAAAKAFVANRQFAGRLLTCDLVCHGVPSRRLFDAYRADLECRCRARAVSVCFRDKTDGWQRYAIRVGFANGKEHKIPFQQDVFLGVYLRDHCLRRSCYRCPFSRLPRQGDLTLADFWGVKKWPEQHRLGVSLVLINTAPGERLLDGCNTVERHPADLLRAAKDNPRLFSGAWVRGYRRRRFLRDLTAMTFAEFAERYSAPPDTPSARRRGKCQEQIWQNGLKDLEKRMIDHGRGGWFRNVLKALLPPWRRIG